MGVDVEDDATEVPRVQRGHEGVLVDDAASSGVHHQRSGSHRRQLGLTDEALRTVEERNVHREHLAALQQRVQVHLLEEARGVLSRGSRIEPHHLRPQGVEGRRHLESDAAESDDADSQPAEPANVGGSESRPRLVVATQLHESVARRNLAQEGSGRHDDVGRHIGCASTGNVAHGAAE